jgi:hypothetical protein
MTTIANTLTIEVNRLKQLSFELLQEIGSREEKSIRCSDGLATFCTWRDAISPDEIRIVVQAYQPGVLGIGRMRAEGFRKSSKGVFELAPHELAEFS